MYEAVGESVQNFAIECCKMQGKYSNSKSVFVADEDKMQIWGIRISSVLESTLKSQVHG